MDAFPSFRDATAQARLDGSSDAGVTLREVYAAAGRAPVFGASRAASSRAPASTPARALHRGEALAVDARHAPGVARAARDGAAQGRARARGGRAVRDRNERSSGPRRPRQRLAPALPLQLSEDARARARARSRALSPSLEVRGRARRLVDVVRSHLVDDGPAHRRLGDAPCAAARAAPPRRPRRRRRRARPRAPGRRRRRRRRGRRRPKRAAAAAAAAARRRPRRASPSRRTATRTRSRGSRTGSRAALRGYRDALFSVRVRLDARARRPVAGVLAPCELRLHLTAVAHKADRFYECARDASGRARYFRARVATARARVSF